MYLSYVYKKETENTIIEELSIVVLFMIFSNRTATSKFKDKVMEKHKQMLKSPKVYRV